MADNVIDSYLIALGFKVDAQSQARFKDTVDGAFKAAAGLAAAWAAAETAIAAAVVKVASSLDSMYFAAQRANTSVANVKAYTYALSQLGVSASAAGSTIEGIARAIRTNPGNESLLHALGVQTRDANGGLRDTVDIMVDLDKQLSKKPQYVGTQYAAALGLDEGTFNALRGKWGAIQKEMDDYRQKAAAMGVDPNKAAAEANQLMTQVRSFQATIDLLVLRIAQDLGPTILKYVKDFGDWITAHQAEIVKFVGELSKALADIATTLADMAKAAGPIVDKFNAMSLAITGKDGLEVALAAVLLYMTTRWVPGMLAAGASAAGAFSWLIPVVGLIAGGSAFNSWVSDQPVRSPVTGKWSRGYSGPGMIYPNNEGFQTGYWDRFKRAAGKTALGRWFGLGGSGQAQSLTTEQQKANAKESFDFWKSKGLTDEQAAGLVANEIHESRTNPNAVGDGGQAKGIFQHHPDRRANIQAGTGIDMANATHAQQLEGAWWELNGPEAAALEKIKAAKTAAEAGAAVSMFYERPLARDAEANNRGATAEKFLAGILAAPAIATPPPTAAPADGGSKADSPQEQWAKKRADILQRNNMLSPDLTGASTPLLPLGMPLPGVHSQGFSQTNSIVVHGASDPKATADEIERRQRGLNGELLGNVKGAMQ
ncbi:phage tail-type lysozyme domain-containing protein [Mesorhizobium sp. BR1-1-16]|uniref:phage tail tip lysozyme n=1 Tax=Mesorhizobium sp. BR1-1-16 TaxID=2876653 RepID=UPI001CCFB5B7|nr:phage tail tip lysozyme [Mesorhizobium sp. BR1-1-16]MBZ9939134.1 phage tail-type lysozyme domain-containing protein [Mesorhizobium sp. BR1-1-16]